MATLAPLLLTLGLGVSGLGAPQGDEDLDAVLKAQARRTAVIQKAAQSVCSVMALNSPGGGSGVIFHPRGFVISNFHVVAARGRPKGRPPGPDQPPDEDEPKPAPMPDQKGDQGDKDLPKIPMPTSWPTSRPTKKATKEATKKKKKDPFGEPPAGDGWDPARKVMKIGLPDGKLYKAQVLGVDPGSDLAILLLEPRKDGKPYPYSPLGDSDALLVGETVFAMGNPFLLATDFTPTLTWGVVSGTHRYQKGRQNRMLVYPDCIQIDAPVNPGNSGGPLFNENGEVVGINGRITVRDRGRVNTGVGFAIASNQIRNFLAEMMAGKHAEHGTLDMNAWYMKSPGETAARVVVQSIFEDSEAFKLGMRTGDQLTHFNQIKITSANQLATLVGVMPTNAWITLGYKPHLENGGFGKERDITFKMKVLDTGSVSRNPDRLADKETRKLARAAMTANVGKGQAVVAGATVVRTGPKGEKIIVQRLGDKLRLTLGKTVYVRTGEDQGFKIEGGAIRELGTAEHLKLERELTANPWLWRGQDLRDKIEGSWLEGGIHVLGLAACRCRLLGKGEMEMFFFEDGSPAGFKYRDPLKRRVVRVMVREGKLWTEIRRKLTKGWKLEEPVYDPLPKAELFERPKQ
ncbi:MAG: S1C family serine protease [Planctomycetota bacterium]|jgi:S1-C subfamily serine protease